MAESSKVIRAQADQRTVGSVRGRPDTRRAAGRLAVVGGFIYLLGQMVDYGILWFLQRQAGTQWEFVALSRSAQAFPNLVIATALIFLGLHVSDRLGNGWVRALSAFVLLLALAGLAVAGLMILSYLGLRAEVDAAAAGTFNQTAFKTVFLGLLYFVFLLPVGLMGFFKRGDT